MLSTRASPLTWHFSVNMHKRTQQEIHSTYAPGNVSYSAAKYGLRGVHEVLIEETRKTGVRASLLEPSATSTTLWNSIDPDGDDKLPSLSEMLLPSDVAQAVAFLCSRPASVHIPVLAIGSS